MAEVELYDNKISKIEGLPPQTLRILDLSYNNIKEIENLPEQLTKIYLVSNRIRRMENLNHLKNVQMVDLSSNKIRKMENLGGLENLRELYLARNEIEEIVGLDLNLKILNLSANQITRLGNLEYPGLEELYISENYIERVESIEGSSLRLLDLSFNKI